MPYLERVATIASLILLGLLLLTLVPLPSQQITFTIFGSELSLRLTGPALIAILCGATACAGGESLLREQPEPHFGSLAYRASFWALPVATTLLGATLVQRLPTSTHRVALSALIALLVAVTMVLQLHAAHEGLSERRGSRLVLNLLAYAMGFSLFGLLYGARLRSLLSATGILLLSGALALEFFRHPSRSMRAWLCAGIVGIIMGELTWALNYSPAGGFMGAAVLLLVYYVLTGLMQHHLWDRLTRRLTIEFVTVLAVGLLLIAGLSPRV